MKLVSAAVPLLVASSVLAQTGIEAPTTFRLYTESGTASFKVLPRKLRFRADYYQPVIISNTTPCDGFTGYPTGRVLPSGGAATGDEAMESMPVFRADVRQNQATRIYFTAGITNHYNFGGIDFAQMKAFMRWKGSTVEVWEGVEADPDEVGDLRTWFCIERNAGYSNATAVNSWNQLPGKMTDWQVGTRWERVTGPLGAGTRINVYCDGRTVTRYRTTDTWAGQVRATCNEGSEWLYVSYVLEEDPGDVGLSEFDDTDIVQAIESLRSLTQNIREDLQDWRTAWNAQNAAWGTKFDAMVASLATLATMAEPPAGGVNAPSEGEEPELPELQADVWDQRLRGPLEDTGIVGMTESHTAPVGPPNWEVSIPIGEWSQHFGGAYIDPFTFNVDFSIMAPYRAAIHTVMFIIVGMWAAGMLWEELRKY